MANPDGVPPLQDFNVDFPVPDIAISDGEGIQETTSPVQWGIFDGTGAPVVVGDSVLAFDYSRDSNVSKYPVEEGGFAAYNKVQTPFGVKLSFTKTGAESERTNFLNDIKVAQDALELFQVITAVKSYSNISISHVDYRQTARHGAQLLLVDVWCEEIRQSPPLQFSDSNATDTAADPLPIATPVNPEATNPTNNGTVQAIAPTPQVSTPAISGANARFGTVTGLLRSPPTITAPLISITNSLGNIVPRSLTTAIRSSITYSQPGGPVTALVSGVLRGSLNQTIGYETNTGLSIGVNRVQHILPPGFGVVQ